jgi:hypothetical protein
MVTVTIRVLELEHLLQILDWGRGRSGSLHIFTDSDSDSTALSTSITGCCSAPSSLLRNTASRLAVLLVGSNLSQVLCVLGCLECTHNPWEPYVASKLNNVDLCFPFACCHKRFTASLQYYRGECTTLTWPLLELPAFVSHRTLVFFRATENRCCHLSATVQDYDSKERRIITPFSVYKILCEKLHSKN